MWNHKVTPCYPISYSGFLFWNSSLEFGVLNLPAYTVATLPTGVQGDRCYVTDALAPTFLTALTGGGAVKCPAFYNGTAWVAG